MKLYVTDGSPYARMARMVVLEKGLDDRVEVVTAQTRRPDSPYYAINPSGRVPCLVRDDGPPLEESALVCAYLDSLEGERVLEEPGGEYVWEGRRLEACARSMLDGLAVWMREVRRPEPERSPTILRHEAERSARMAQLWEREIAHPWMQRSLNIAQMTLACALGLENRFANYTWRPGHPRLCTWFDAFSQRPSYRHTAPADPR